ncbi:PAS domain S-box-containing protein [Halobacillus karajensis]|uniref:Arginine utilization regulatory protein RocR n=2 Tax=Halobacillus karajensis TaxID=195088 RepID=A0A024P691_9BACI|nr:Arginine utilization regulatory protein RocR [Halobacillus karajensis]CDQ24283.1 Arginine utilization regulatory protein RocR [Halobacillus karajensis]CDQ29468.1 Arginine utilization regulatory protein RocR [Halobacillus karajensis]SEH62369.1 PAS domain S-box-containing protein [Halobacillus karajensis]
MAELVGTIDLLAKTCRLGYDEFTQKVAGCGEMKRVLIVGAGKGGTALLKLLNQMERMFVVAVTDINSKAPGLSLARSYGIATDQKWEDWIHKDIDIVIEATGEEKVFNQIREVRERSTVVIPGSVAYVTAELLEDKESLVQRLKQQTENQHLILNSIHDGMIVIDEFGKVSFINRSAERIIGKERASMVGSPINEIIPDSRLPQVVASRKEEVNQKLTLDNGKKVVTTRIPMIGGDHKIIGAFAVFKDITEVVNLAEEITDLKEVKTMLEAIIHSSDEAITVVDENGSGLMINPAYTRITGLTEEEIVGKPATVDISEGESMHMKVLRTRRAVRGVRMKVGPSKKDVLVNVAPVIVDGKLKGSVGVLHDVSEIQALTSELKRARQIIRSLEAKYTFDDIIGDSQEMTLALEQAKVGARTPASVLLRGESGTGKELFAHAIHNESKRRHNKFIRVNCAAIAESLLESELFGYEDGAFSGAKRGGKKGLFEEANHGSIFLDEIGELTLPMQAKLLRVLQENEIIRVGGTKPIHVDVRVIAATNVNLEKAIMSKDFREDLYYRLNRLPIYIPPLRERKEDVELLTDHLIQKLNEDYGRHVTSVDEEAFRILKEYDWPGNVRELENIIGRAMIYMENMEDTIRSEHLPRLRKASQEKDKQQGEAPWLGETLQQAVDEYEKNLLADAYRTHEFNKTKTAKALGISIRNLYYKLDKYKLDKDSMQDYS